MWQTGKRWAKARTGRLALAVVMLFLAGLGLGLASGKLNLSGGGVRTVPVAVGIAHGTPASVAELVARVSGSVVNIRGSKEGPQEGAGSGVFISPDGEILTTAPVVSGATAITVTLASQQVYTATVLGRDPQTALALLKIHPPAPLPVARLGDSDRLRVGSGPWWSATHWAWAPL